MPNDKSILITGATGSAPRKFLHSDNAADTCQFLMSLDNSAFSSLITLESSPTVINIGVGEDITIAELAVRVRTAVGFSARIVYDHVKRDGTPSKLLDVNRFSGLGWRTKTTLAYRLARPYTEFLRNRA